jgi:tRNA threonylcarbamoyladenosine biosynthesis protein TsaE
MSAVTPQSSYQILGEEAMVAFGRAVGCACFGQQAVIFLQGDLGMGKTTLSRGVLTAFGHQGAVKSPTYTLVEPYEFERATVYHFDLYRLGSPEELEYMGIRDYFEESQTICLIEWAEKALKFLPTADIVVSITHIDGGREASLVANTTVGEAIVARLQV